MQSQIDRINDLAYWVNLLVGTFFSAGFLVPAIVMIGVAWLLFAYWKKDVHASLSDGRFLFAALLVVSTLALYGWMAYSTHRAEQIFSGPDDVIGF